ncbi:MAG: Fic family protein [Blastochloris viridis]|uniref:Fic family protein n=1 Tax=Blastochloris viridis TaxID=1079 RepID=A0A6N4RD64_BLAVI|nr:MAG: Fic family protein [Blastochloris viridis]
MTWNWELKEWPEFRYNAERLTKLEADFLFNSGLLKGELRHVQCEDQDFLKVELISTEALMTSEIEGEILNRDSLQSSIRGNLGLQTDHRRIPAAEAGISEMMVNLYQTFQEPLTDEMLFAWHKLLMNGRTDVLAGAYRVDPEPMQVVSGPVYDPIIHFEAPKAAAIPAEMAAYIHWFNDSGPGGAHPLPPLTRAGLAHIYFECIHPFDDGNGRIGRALVEKALSQNLGYPTLIALSHTIAQRKKSYYDSLELNNKSMEISNWLEYFAEKILEAQQYTLRLIRFLIAKAKLYDRVRGQMNERQEKAIERMFREGPEGFAGGMSASKYMVITGATSATTTRDLQHLAEIGALKAIGKGSGMRYHLELGEI